MKQINLFLGIKAEQTLRDAARSADAGEPLELCPFGKKDWIVGRRIGSSAAYGELERKRLELMGRLIRLGSHQRIRQENVHLYAMRPPVPVFRDPMPEEMMAGVPANRAPVRAAGDPETMGCPVCGTEVHRYNLQRDPSGRITGCYLCRGERKDKNGGVP